MLYDQQALLLQELQTSSTHSHHFDLLTARFSPDPSPWDSNYPLLSKPAAQTQLLDQPLTLTHCYT